MKPIRQKGQEIKKILRMGTGLLLVIMMSLGTGASAFAGSEVTKTAMPSWNISDNERNDSITKIGNNFVVEGNQTDFILPQNANEKIKVNNKYGFSFELPDIAGNVNGTVTSKGEMVYNTKGNGKIVVTALKQGQEGIIFDGLRTSIETKEKMGVQKYRYHYNLEPGQRLVTAKEYLGEDTGEVLIVGKEGDVAVIDPAMAMDSHGNNLQTHYEIEGDTLVQVVDVPKDGTITVSSTTHPNKSESKYLTEKEVKAVIDGFTAGEKDMNKLSDVFSILGTTGEVMSALFDIDAAWCRAQKAKYQSYYNQMNNTTKKYLKVTTTYRWRNGGKNSGYVPSGQTFALVATKPTNA